jgi:hypothetical protein
MGLRHFVRKDNVDKLNRCMQFIVCNSSQHTIYIEAFTCIIDPNNIKLKCN